MLEKSTKKVASKEPKYPLEGGEQHNFFGIGCRDILPCSQSPLEHGVIREKMILN
jgi:hypothetical protein